MTSSSPSSGSCSTGCIRSHSWKIVPSISLQFSFLALTVILLFLITVFHSSEDLTKNISHAFCSFQKPRRLLLLETTSLGSDPICSSYRVWLGTNTGRSCHQSTVYTLTRILIWWSILFNFKARIYTSLTLGWTTLRVKHTFPSL